MNKEDQNPLMNEEDHSQSYNVQIMWKITVITLVRKITTLTHSEYYKPQTSEEVNISFTNEESSKP